MVENVLNFGDLKSTRIKNHQEGLHKICSTWLKKVLNVSDLKCTMMNHQAVLEKYVQHC